MTGLPLSIYINVWGLQKEGEEASAPREGYRCILPVVRFLGCAMELGGAHDDVYQVAWDEDDFLYGVFADEGGDAWVCERQGAGLLFADAGRDFDAFAHFAVDLDDQGEGFVVGHFLVIARPVGHVNAAGVASDVPQLFGDV